MVLKLGPSQVPIDTARIVNVALSASPELRSAILTVLAAPTIDNDALYALLRRLPTATQRSLGLSTPRTTIPLRTHHAAHRIFDLVPSLCGDQICLHFFSSPSVLRTYKYLHVGPHNNASAQRCNPLRLAQPQATSLLSELLRQSTFALWLRDEPIAILHELENGTVLAITYNTLHAPIILRGAQSAQGDATL